MADASCLRALALSFLAIVALTACERPDPALIPDDVLQSELGLTPDDRVHTIRLSTGVSERATPDTLTIRPGDYVQFVSVDRMIHEVAFAMDSMPASGRAFLQRTGQDTSTPLVELDARFVVSFDGAPEGRYPYTLAGNRGAGGGSIVVEVPPR